MEYTPPRITTRQALEWFDTDELRQLKTDITDNFVERLQAIPKPKTTKDETLKWVRQSVYEIELEEVMGHFSRVGKTIERKLHSIDFPDVPGTITQDQIDRAREYPIEDLVETPVRRGMALCPFHPDNNPSMSVQKYNRYKCFSCDAKGDAIDFYMKTREVDFLTAVARLSPL